MDIISVAGPRSSRELTRDVDTVASVDDQIRFTRKTVEYALIHGRI